jgi:hypothetical protein
VTFAVVVISFLIQAAIHRMMAVPMVVRICDMFRQEMTSLRVVKSLHLHHHTPNCAYVLIVLTLVLFNVKAFFQRFSKIQHHNSRLMICILINIFRIYSAESSMEAALCLKKTSLLFLFPLEREHPRQAHLSPPYLWQKHMQQQQQQQQQHRSSL